MKQLVKLLINWCRSAKGKDYHVIRRMRKAKDYTASITLTPCRSKVVASILTLCKEALAARWNMDYVEIHAG